MKMESSSEALTGTTICVEFEYYVIGDSGINDFLFCLMEI